MEQNSETILFKVLETKLKINGKSQRDICSHFLGWQISIKDNENKNGTESVM